MYAPELVTVQLVSPGNLLRLQRHANNIATTASLTHSERTDLLSTNQIREICLLWNDESSARQNALFLTF